MRLARGSDREPARAEIPRCVELLVAAEIPSVAGAGPVNHVESDGFGLHGRTAAIRCASRADNLELPHDYTERAHFWFS